MVSELLVYRRPGKSVQGTSTAADKPASPWNEISGSMLSTRSSTSPPLHKVDAQREQETRHRSTPIE